MSDPITGAIAFPCDSRIVTPVHALVGSEHGTVDPGDAAPGFKSLVDLQ